jgi:hypothetical protein
MEKQEPRRMNSIKSIQELVEFMAAKHVTRRWYIARLYAEDLKDPYLDLYYAPISQAGRSALKEFTADTLLRQPADNLEWWQAENFDLPVHIPLSGFRSFLQEYSNYRPDQPVEEGMVFIELWSEGKMSFIPFSFQAREASKEIYQRLLGKSSEPGSKGEEK